MASFTKLYLTTKTAPYTPATIRGGWEDTAGAVTRMLDTIKGDGGAITSVARAETNASNVYDVLLYRGVSGPIAAQTFSGTINVMLGVLESNAAADFAYYIHAYVTQGDSDTVRGTLLANYFETTANEWPTAAAGKALASAQTVGAVVASAGDRIVVEIGFRALNTVTTSYTGTLRYGTQNPTDFSAAPDLTAGSTAVTTSAGYIVFSVAITENDVNTRVTQLPVEVVDVGSKEARLSQFAVEVIDAGSKEARISQLAVEMITSGTVGIIRMSQLPVEIINRGLHEIMLSQLIVEVIAASAGRKKQPVIFIVT